MNEVAVILFSILLSALFSGMEIAFVTSNKLKIELDKKRGHLSARIMSGFARTPSNFIATVLVANNVTLVIYGLSMAELLEPIIALHLPDRFESKSLVMLLQTIVSTLIILVTAEFLPKVLFRIQPNYILNVFAVPLWMFYYLLYPVVFVFLNISTWIIRTFFKVKIKEVAPIFSFVDLDHYLKEFAGNHDEEMDESPEVQMFQKAIDFRNLKIRECMVPRTEIVSIEINEPIETLKKRFIETGFSKLMVYVENIDRIIGYVHSYDIFRNPLNTKSILRPVIIVPGTMPANKLLTMFIQQQKNVAIIVDEFGGTSGMVTMEDVIEEIFGEIEDEFDEDDFTERILSDREYIFSGRLEVDYLNEKYKLNLPESDEYETLAGLIIEHHASIPALHDEITIKQFRFKILMASEKHIEKVLLKIRD